MDLADKWSQSLYKYEKEPGKSYYIYDGIKYTVYGIGETGKCNVIIETFLRINNMYIWESRNYCKKYKSLYDKLLPTLNEYGMYKFDGRLGKVVEESERDKIEKLYNAYKSYYSSAFTGIKDIDIMILSKLDDNSLTKVCQASRYVKILCDNDTLYRIKAEKYIKNKYNENIWNSIVKEFKNEAQVYSKYKASGTWRYPSPIKHTWKHFYTTKDEEDGYGKELMLKYEPINEASQWSTDLLTNLNAYNKYMLVRKKLHGYFDGKQKIISDEDIKANEDNVFDLRRDDIKVPSLRVIGNPDDIKNYFILLGVPSSTIEQHIAAGEKIFKNN